jgi:hypothetical protein
MIFAEPPKPAGTSPEARYVRYLGDMIHGPLKLLAGPGLRLERTNTGTRLFTTPVPAGGTAATAKEFHFQQSLGDYFLTTEGVPIAKLPELRCSIGSSTVYGVVIGFTYPHNPAHGGPSADPLGYLYRVANYGGQTERQGIIPAYYAGNTIMAIPCQTTVMSDPADLVTSPGGIPQPINWVQISPAAWTRFADQSFGT